MANSNYKALIGQLKTIQSLVKNNLSPLKGIQRVSVGGQTFSFGGA